MTLTRVRPALAAAVIGAAGIGGLLALEHVTPSAPPAAVIDIVKAKQTNPGVPSNGNHEKHCTDGKGMDDEKNKHCRNVSGAQ